MINPLCDPDNDREAKRGTSQFLLPTLGSWSCLVQSSLPGSGSKMYWPFQVKSGLGNLHDVCRQFWSR
jgi:hypothetical protein